MGEDCSFVLGKIPLWLKVKQKSLLKNGNGHYSVTIKVYLYGQSSISMDCFFWEEIFLF